MISIQLLHVLYQPGLQVTTHTMVCCPKWDPYDVPLFSACKLRVATSLENFSGCTEDGQRDPHLLRQWHGLAGCSCQALSVLDTLLQAGEDLLTELISYILYLTCSTLLIAMNKRPDR